MSSRFVQVTRAIVGRMTTDTAPHLQTERRRVSLAAATAAERADQDFMRFAGRALMLAAEVNGADAEVERLNERLAAEGHANLVASATSRLRRPLDATLIDAIAAALVRCQCEPSGDR